MKYVEIFAYQSSGTLKTSKLSLPPNQQVLDNLRVNLSPKSEKLATEKYKELEIYKENYNSKKENSIPSSFRTGYLSA